MQTNPAPEKMSVQHAKPLTNVKELTGYAHGATTFQMTWNFVVQKIYAEGTKAGTDRERRRRRPLQGRSTEGIEQAPAEPDEVTPLRAPHLVAQ